MKKILITLSVIFVFGFILRSYQLGEFPSGFHRDEAFLGYNAYSILKTGRDMTGDFLPLHLRSFLYSPAGYAYFSIPFIILFDLSIFSVRFASAFFGSLTILITFFLVKELFDKYPFKNILALLSSLLLSISPWHINLSRASTENIIVVFFMTLGVYLLLKWSKTSKQLFLIGGFFSFLITLFLYQAPRAFLPLFILLLGCFLFSKFEKKKFILFLTFYILIIILPLIFILPSRDLSLRLRTVSIFATEQTQLVLDQHIREDGVYGISPFVVRIFHNKILGYSNALLQNYFSHFTYNFLFTDAGFPDRYRIPWAGLVYLIELPFLILGVWKLTVLRNKVGLLLLGWVVLTPFGSALTFDDIPNLQRTLIIFPSISILSALGILTILEFAPKKVSGFKRPLIGILAIIFSFQLVFYLHQYYFHAPVYRPWYRQDGYGELFKKVNTVLASYDKAVITNHESAPAIFFLFYSKYDPAAYQAETKNSPLSDFDRVNFSKYVFSTEECPATIALKDREKHPNIIKENILYVNSGLCEDSPSEKILDVIKRKDNSKAFQLVEI